MYQPKSKLVTGRLFHDTTLDLARFVGQQHATSVKTRMEKGTKVFDAATGGIIVDDPALAILILKMTIEQLDELVREIDESVLVQEQNTLPSFPQLLPPGRS